jgi:hypothetical protein
MSIIFIGVDDTDILGSAGTGRVARGLADCFMAAGLGVSLGVSRHQLLVDSHIPYTSHNSSKGLAFKTESAPAAFIEQGINYLKNCVPAGSDPGLCICAESQATQDVIAWGKRAQTEVLTKKESKALALKYSIILREIGGDGGGIIGALAAVGLRATGNDGRLVTLPGIKEIKGMVTVSQILSASDIKAVRDESGKELRADEIIDSKDWIRPTLINGQPVLKVKPVRQVEGKTIWQSIEQRHSEKKDVEHSHD